MELKTLYVKIKAAQDKLPSSEGVINRSNSRRVINVPRFVIRVNVSLYVCPVSDESNRFQVRSVIREIRIPCCTLSGSSAAEARMILSYRLPVSLPGRDGALFMKKLYGECFSGCPDAVEDKDWVEEFQDFLLCVRRKSDNLGHNVLPVSLNIDTLCSTSDIDYFDWICWLRRQRQLNPNMGRTWTALSTSFEFHATKGDGDCPICLEDLNAAIPLCLSCSHCFHLHCLWSWLNANPSCPVCRFEFEDTLNC